MKIKTSELSGVALDWAVAQACGDWVRVVSGKVRRRFNFQGDYAPSSDWSQGGPLIERFRVDLTCECGGLFYAETCDEHGSYSEHFRGAFGPTHLIAACRAIVAAKLGDEVDVLEGLV